MSDSDIAVSQGESFRDSLEHSMNPELQKVTRSQIVQIGR